MSSESVVDYQGALVTMLPPPVAGPSSAEKNSGPNPITVNGRVYTATLGSSVQVPAQDASIMEANGWTRFGRFSGTTAQRPTPPYVSRRLMYYDTTLSAMIVWDGATWRSAAGASV